MSGSWKVWSARLRSLHFIQEIIRVMKVYCRWLMVLWKAISIVWDVLGKMTGGCRPRRRLLPKSTEEVIIAWNRMMAKIKAETGDAGTSGALGQWNERTGWTWGRGSPWAGGRGGQCMDPKDEGTFQEQGKGTVLTSACDFLKGGHSPSVLRDWRRFRRSLGTKKTHFIHLSHTPLCSRKGLCRDSSPSYSPKRGVLNTLKH